MKTLTIFTILLSFSFGLFAQQNDKFSDRLTQQLNEQGSQSELLVWIYFTDKGENISKYVDNPRLVVSEKSLQRRSKVLPAENLITNYDIPVYQSYINGIEEIGITIKQKSRWLNAVSTFADRRQLEFIAALSYVQRIDIVMRYGKQEPLEMDKPIEPGSYGIQPEGVHSLDYGASFTQNNQINVPAVHDMGYYGQGVTICVLDAGFNRLSHETFNNMNIIAAWDFVNNDPDVGDGSDMGTGSHGTKTLSTIGGFSPGELIGPAYGSDYILAKTENTDSETPIEEDNWVAALEWADSIGVDVTSTSLGYLDYDYPYTGYTYMDMDGNTAVITIAADIAVSLGIVVVNSAGNEGYNSSHNTLSAPADGDSVISVGAVNSSGSRVSFSSVGNTVDGRIKPDIMAMGSNVTVASSYSNTGYTAADGTSFSCPLSAGVAALILSFNPGLTPMQVRDALRSTGSNSLTPDREYGWGIIDALAALEYAITPDTTPPDAVNDLNISDIASDELKLTWTVPNDTTVGGIVRYDIRYSTSPITDTNDFNSALPILFPTQPDTIGAVESLLVDSLDFSTIYYFALRSYDHFSNVSELSNIATDTTLAAPVMSVTPDSIFHILHNQTQIVDTILIGNISNEPSTLDYSVMFDNHSFPQDKLQSRIIPLRSDFTEHVNQKGFERIGGGQMIEGSGGPDNFGYQWIDSDETGGPAYEWNDIAATGTNITNWTPSGSFPAKDEGYAGPISIGFPFDFYGNEKTELYVATNGIILFTPLSENIISNSSIPNNDFPNEYISPFWDDLDGTSQGDVYYEQQGSKFIIQFDQWQRYPDQGNLTFQVVLHTSGKIQFFYKTMQGTTLNSATIGIENISGSDGLQMAYNTAYAKNMFAVEITAEPEWLFAQTAGGRLYNNNTAALELTILTEDLPQGEYSMDVIVSSNDPAAQQITVPVMLGLDNSIPALIEPLNGASELPLDVMLTWSGSDADTFHLQTSFDEDFSSLIIDNQAITDTFYQLTGLEDGSQYFWRVRGISEGESGYFTKVRSFTTHLPQPENLSAAAADILAIDLSWNDMSQNELGFIIERKEGNLNEPGAFQIIDSVAADISTYRDSSGLADSTWYTYRLKAYNTVTESGYTDSIDVKTPVPVGTHEQTIPTHYELTQNYPNPFNPVTTIQFALPEAGYCSLTIYDMLGSKIRVLINENLPAGRYNTRFNGTDYASGTYIYELKVNDKRFTRKMLLLK